MQVKIWHKLGYLPTRILSAPREAHQDDVKGRMVIQGPVNFFISSIF